MHKKIRGKVLKKLNTISKEFIKKERTKGGWEGKEKYYKNGKEFDPGNNRLGNLIDKNKLFKELIKIPEILVAANTVIQSKFKVCGLNLRDPKKGKESKLFIQTGSQEIEKVKICWYYLYDLFR